VGCQLDLHDLNALVTFEEHDDVERKDLGRRLRHVVDQHAAERHDFEE
jgi:hypothetical protein